MQTEQPMRIAITIWNDRISPVFDVTANAVIFECEGQVLLSRSAVALTDGSAIAKVAQLVEAGADVLVCGAISRDAHVGATNAGLRVYAFIAGDAVEVLQALLVGRLEGADYAMPGCGRRAGCHGGGPKGRGRRCQVGSGLFPRLEQEERKV